MNIVIIKFYLFITIIISFFLLSGCGKDINVEQLSEEDRAALLQEIQKTLDLLFDWVEDQEDFEDLEDDADTSSD